MAVDTKEQSFFLFFITGHTHAQLWMAADIPILYIYGSNQAHWDPYRSLSYELNYCMEKKKKS